MEVVQTKLARFEALGVKMQTSSTGDEDRRLMEEWLTLYKDLFSKGDELADRLASYSQEV